MKSNADSLSSFIRFIQLKSLRARTQESYLTWVRPVAWKFGLRLIKTKNAESPPDVFIFCRPSFCHQKPDSHPKTKPHEEPRQRLPTPHRLPTHCGPRVHAHAATNQRQSITEPPKQALEGTTQTKDPQVKAAKHKHAGTPGRGRSKSKAHKDPSLRSPAQVRPPRG